eukprot:5488795-Amphidinium_carterae.2
MKLRQVSRHRCDVQHSFVSPLFTPYRVSSSFYVSFSSDNHLCDRVYISDMQQNSTSTQDFPKRKSAWRQ